MMYGDYPEFFSFYSNLGAGALAVTQVTSWIISLAAYIFTALGLYTLAKNRGISKPWLAWIPVLNVWTLGSVSDQYRYVTRGEVRSKRKALLVLSILKLVLSVVAAVCLIRVGVSVVSQGFSPYMEDAMFLRQTGSDLLTIVVCALTILGISIAYFIISCMALYDLYISCDPGNGVLFLVLSILFFGIPTPYFIFFNRNKELGMPPRRQTVYADPQGDYL